MKAVLLAAGRSKRMWPLEDKNFLDFFGRSLLEIQLAGLMKNGFNEVAIVCGKHNLEVIGQLVAKYSPQVAVTEQKDLDTGMCGAVLAAKKFIAGDPVLVFSSNDVVDEEAFVLIRQAFEAGGADSYLLGKMVDEYFPGGYLDVEKNAFIKGIVEKPKPGTEPSDMVNLVLHIHKNSEALIKALEKSRSKHDDLYEVALDHLIKKGVKMKAVAYEGFWQPIKFPWHVHKVFSRLFYSQERGISPDCEIAAHAVVEGNVTIEAGAKILDGAVIIGPAYIGKNAIIATNALVRDSYIGDNCVIGFASEIARSYLGRGVWTHSNYIGDSVISDNVSFGAGTVTGNLRLDEEEIADSGSNKLGLICGPNVRVGVNVSFMPGVKVGGESFIAAGIVVAEDIPEKSFVRAKTELKISENKFNIKEKTRSYEAFNNDSQL